jgi:hypothetical protein
MFEDAAATIPIALERPVGLLRDKSGRGNHATQTFTARPTLSARYNFLNYTEDFSNAVWNKTTTSVNPTPVTDPLGGLTAYTISANTNNAFFFYSSTNNPTNTVVTVSFWARRRTGTGAFRVRTSNIIPSVDTPITLPVDGSNQGIWTQFSIPCTVGTLPASNCFVLSLVTSGDSFDLWHPDLRVANNGVGLPSYQRVVTGVPGTSTAAGSSDYDTVGFPPYLKFDGTDDAMETSSINFTATDKVGVWIGARKNSTAVNILFELSNSTFNNTNAFVMLAPRGTTTGDYGFQSKGTTASIAFTGNDYAPPITNTLAGFGNIVTPSVSINVNGVERNSSSTTQGTGNYGNYPLYIGARGGTQFFFSGNVYSIIARGALSTATEISDTETFVNSKTKAY